jgi:hypothetical protein
MTNLTVFPVSKKWKQENVLGKILPNKGRVGCPCDHCIAAMVTKKGSHARLLKTRIDSWTPPGARHCPTETDWGWWKIKQNAI